MTAPTALPTPATLPQLHALRNALAALDIKTRPDRLTATSVLAQRVLGSSKDLTAEEASRFIDRVKGMPAWETAEFDAEVERLRAGLYDPWAEVGAA